jgi:hypothetical protein
MVARAVDLVIYQKHFEFENTRRITEVLEVERPGVRFGVAGDIEHKVRRLVAWSSDDRRWTFPERPSTRLRGAFAAVGVSWPVADGAGPSQGAKALS